MSASPPDAAPRAPLILVVDDSEDVRVLLSMVLRKRGYTVELAADGLEALARAAGPPAPDLILLDIEMPGKNGYEVCKLLKSSPITSPIPVIFVTARDNPKDEALGLTLGAVDYITKPVNPPIVLARVATHIALSNQKLQLELRVAERTAELQNARHQLIQRLSRAMSFREGGLTNRAIRVAQYAKLLAESAGARKEASELIAQAAPLHDIGTLGIPEAVLHSTDRLNARDWEEVRRHPLIGAEIIGEQKDPLLATARVIALTHHERWDGSGYPKGLAGNDIPWPGRVVAIADAFEAMTATQRRREPMSIEEAAAAIVAESGKQFDPTLIDAFRRALPRMASIRRVIRDELKGIHELDFSAPPAPESPAAPPLEVTAAPPPPPTAVPRPPSSAKSPPVPARAPSAAPPAPASAKPVAPATASRPAQQSAGPKPVQKGPPAARLPGTGPVSAKPAQVGTPAKPTPPGSLPRKPPGASG